MNTFHDTVIPAKRSAERESNTKFGVRGWIPAERAGALAGMTIAGVAS